MLLLSLIWLHRPRERESSAQKKKEEEEEIGIVRVLLALDLLLIRCLPARVASS